MTVGGGLDYSIDSSVVEFTAGQTKVPLTVTINYDDVCELNEMFTLEIDQYSIFVEDINVAYPYHTTVTIVDDESKYPSHYEQYSYSYCVNKSSCVFYVQ